MKLLRTVFFAAIAAALTASRPAAAQIPPAPPSAPRLVVEQGHSDGINDIVFSGDGKYVATASEDKTIKVWDLATRREIYSLQVPIGQRPKDDTRLGRVAWTTFTPDSQAILGAGYGTVIGAWLVKDGRFAGTLPNQGALTMAARYLPDSSALLVGGPPDLNDSHNAVLRDSKTGFVKRFFGRKDKEADANFVHERGVAVRPDGKQIALALTASVQLWDLADEKAETPTFTLEGDGSDFTSISYSADNRFIATGDTSGKLRVWDTATGKPLMANGTASQSPICVAFHPRIPQLLAVARRDSQGACINLLDLKNKAGRRIPIPGLGALESVNCIAFAPVAMTLAIGTDSGGVAFWDIENNGSVVPGPDGRGQRFQPAPNGEVRDLAVRSDGKVLATVGENLVRMWNLSQGRLGKVLSPAGATMGLSKVALSADGKWVAASGTGAGTADPGDVVLIWDASTGNLTRKITAPKGDVAALLLDPAGSTVTALSTSGTATIWSVSTGNVLETIPFNGEGHAAALAPDGKSLYTATRATGGTQDTVRVLDMATGKVLQTWSVSGRVTDLAVRPDGKAVVTAGVLLEMWDPSAGKRLRLFAQDDKGGAWRCSFSPDGTRLASDDGNARLRIWDVATGKGIRALDGFTREVTSLGWTPDGKYVAGSSKDQTTRLWDSNTGKERVRLYGLGGSDAAAAQEEWAVITPEGAFDGTETALRRMHWSVGGQPLALETFYQNYFSSRLLASALGYNGAAGDSSKPTPVQIETDVAKGTPPTVAIITPAAATTYAVEVTVEATEQGGGGVKAIRLYQNGRLVGGSSLPVRGIAVESVSGPVTTKKFAVTLTPGENILRAVAYSRTDLESKSAEAKVTYAAPAAAKPTLHVLTIGVNVYKDATMNLSYARPDAEAVADFFGKMSPTLFGKVDITRLVDAEASGAAIRKSFAALSDATKPEDVAFVYLAGHGQAVDDGWYFLPADARQMALDERVKEFGISGKEIDALIGKIPARKIVLVYDACKSGAALGGGLRGGVSDEQALGMLARAQGIHILTASTGQQYAAEVKELGHGILTYALLEGLNGKASSSGSTDVFIRNLLSYVEDRVPVLTKQYRGSEQYPVPFERGQNFPLVSK